MTELDTDSLSDNDFVRPQDRLDFVEYAEDQEWDKERGVAVQESEGKKSAGATFIT